jgi:hypothetical protein
MNNSKQTIHSFDSIQFQPMSFHRIKGRRTETALTAIVKTNVLDTSSRSEARGIQEVAKRELFIDAMKQFVHVAAMLDDEPEKAKRPRDDDETDEYDLPVVPKKVAKTFHRPAVAIPPTPVIPPVKDDAPPAADTTPAETLPAETLPAETPRQRRARLDQEAIAQEQAKLLVAPFTPRENDLVNMFADAYSTAATCEARYNAAKAATGEPDAVLDQMHHGVASQYHRADETLRGIRYTISFSARSAKLIDAAMKIVNDAMVNDAAANN